MAAPKESDEDVPSDFFDDFNKDDFMQGLSVVDSWDDSAKRRTRIDADAVESVGDLRELMQDKNKGSRKSLSSCDDFIKPGSRRDPSKTNAAIKRDKEAKVKDYLAKSLVDDLCPPGTELDDYFDDTKSLERKRLIQEATTSPSRHSPKAKVKRSSKDKDYGGNHKKHLSQRSPGRTRRSPKIYGLEPAYRKQQPTYLGNKREYPLPSANHRRSPRRVSPRRSPRRISPRRSPRRSGPRRSPRRNSPRRRFSRSPERRLRRSRSRSPFHYTKRSRSRSRGRRSPLRGSISLADDFLYPNNSAYSNINGSPLPPVGYPAMGQGYPDPTAPYVGVPEYSYPTWSTNDPYVATPSIPPMMLQPVPSMPPMMSQPVPSMPPMMSQPVPSMPPLASQPVPSMPQPVPAPIASAPVVSATAQPPTAVPTANSSLDTSSAHLDPLAKLLAEGKISHEDYLKLTPNKGSDKNLLTRLGTRVEVLNRCSLIMGKLDKLTLPNKLVMNTTMLGPEPKTIEPKYCSPLKRMMPIEFHFTKTNGSTTQHNRQLINSIIAAVGLDKEILKPTGKSLKNMKDAAVQTSKPFCDMCEIRETTEHFDVGTSIDPEYFSSSTHTQVVEHELNSTKAVFSSSGGTRDGAAPISLAHLTPAQLVSQLAARAKSLQQSEPSSQPQYSRRPQNSNYDYENRGGGNGGYGNYDNYRY